MSRYVVTPLIVALSPGHSDITRLVHGHQLRQEIISIALKKFQNSLRQLAMLTFLIRVQEFWDPLRGELPHVQIFMNDDPTRSREMPSCSAINLADIRLPSKISS